MKNDSNLAKDFINLYETKKHNIQPIVLKNLKVKIKLVVLTGSFKKKFQ